MLDAERERFAGVENLARLDVAQARHQFAKELAPRRAVEIRLADLGQSLARRQIQIEELRQLREDLLE